MNHSDRSVKSTTLSAIKRHSMDPSSANHSRYYETDEMPDPGGVNFQLQLAEGELVIASSIFSETDWTLVTTRQVLGMLNGSMRKLRIQDIQAWMWGDFKGYKETPFTVMTLTTNEGGSNDFVLETGNASMVLIYAVMTATKLIRPKAPTDEQTV